MLHRYVFSSFFSSLFSRGYIGPDRLHHFFAWSPCRWCTHCCLAVGCSILLRMKLIFALQIRLVPPTHRVQNKRLQDNLKTSHVPLQRKKETGGRGWGVEKEKGSTWHFSFGYQFLYSLISILFSSPAATDATYIWKRTASLLRPILLGTSFFSLEDSVALSPFLVLSSFFSFFPCGDATASYFS